MLCITLKPNQHVDMINGLDKLRAVYIAREKHSVTLRFIRPTYQFTSKIWIGKSIETHLGTHTIRVVLQKRTGNKAYLAFDLPKCIRVIRSSYNASKRDSSNAHSISS